MDSRGGLATLTPPSDGVWSTFSNLGTGPLTVLHKVTQGASHSSHWEGPSTMLRSVYAPWGPQGPCVQGTVNGDCSRRCFALYAPELFGSVPVPSPSNALLAIVSIMADGYLACLSSCCID